MDLSALLRRDWVYSGDDIDAHRECLSAIETGQDLPTTGGDPAFVTYATRFWEAHNGYVNDIERILHKRRGSPDYPARKLYSAMMQTTAPSSLTGRNLLIIANCIRTTAARVGRGEPSDTKHAIIEFVQSVSFPLDSIFKHPSGVPSLQRSGMAELEVAFQFEILMQLFHLAVGALKRATDMDTTVMPFTTMSALIASINPHLPIGRRIAATARQQHINGLFRRLGIWCKGGGDKPSECGVNTNAGAICRDHYLSLLR